jgi:hypothetical protein
MTTTQRMGAGIVGRGTKQRPTSSCRSPVGNSVGPCGLTLD